MNLCVLSFLALWLLGAEEVLVAALGLGVGVLGTLGVAGTPLIHVNLVLNVALMNSKVQYVTNMFFVHYITGTVQRYFQPPVFFLHHSNLSGPLTNG